MFPSLNTLIVYITTSPTLTSTGVFISEKLEVVVVSLSSVNGDVSGSFALFFTTPFTVSIDFLNAKSIILSAGTVIFSKSSSSSYPL